MERVDEKKPTQWWAGWMAKRFKRRAAKETRDRLRRLEERGEWGYIPPGTVFISKRKLKSITCSLAVILLSNTIILFGQWRIYRSQPQTTGTAAMTPPTAATKATQ